MSQKGAQEGKIHTGRRRGVGVLLPMLLAMAGSLGQATSAQATIPPAPAIFAVDPHTGPSNGGTPVVILGANFDGATSLTFGGIPVRNFFVFNTGHNIKTWTPPGNGAVDVTVTTAGGRNAVGAAARFSYAPPGQPAVYAIDPRQGTVAGGTNVTVYGLGFSAAASVTFGSGPLACALQQPFSPSRKGPQGNGFGTPCVIIDDTQLTVASSPGSGTVDIRVTAQAGPTSAISGADKFTYVAAAAPKVYAVGPNHGSAGGGTQVTIFGVGLAGAMSVAFGSTSLPPCPAFSVPRRPSQRLPQGGGGGGGCFPRGTDTQINLGTPPGTPLTPLGPIDVTVTTPAGTSTPNAGSKYTYEPAGPPSVDAIDPGHGSAAGGTFLQLNGRNFTGASMVTFSGTPPKQLSPCTPQTQGSCFNVNGDNFIGIPQIPPGTANTTVDVQVTVGAAQSLPGPAARYTYDAPLPPVISAVSPNHASAAGGTQLSLFGAHLAGATDVAVGTTHLVPCPTAPGTPCFNRAGDTSITLPAPPGTAGGTTITVTTPTSPPASIAFTYDALQAPIIDLVSPNTGPLNGGTSVWISGRHLGGATNVTFDGRPAGFFYPAFGSDSVIQANTPGGTQTTTPIDIEVTTFGGVSVHTANDHFTYTAAVTPSPAVTSVSPVDGLPAGGTSVYISGSGFTGASGVAFGTTTILPCPQTGAPCFSLTGDTLIQATTPSRGTNPAQVDVTVTVGGVTSPITVHFTFTSTPTPPPSGPYINALNANHAPSSGGGFITIIGGHFNGATGVQFGTAAPLPLCGGGGPCFFINDDNHLGVNTPVGPAGQVHVTVIKAAATSPPTDADLFTFVTPGPPSVDAVSPNRGATFGGGQVILNGRNLSSVDSVTFGTTPPTVLPACPGTGPGGCFNAGQENTIFVNGVPPGGAGTVHITVHNSSGTSPTTVADQYTYFVEPAPTITRINPSSGPSVGGTTVYITGTNLDSVTQVRFGQTSLMPFSFSSATPELLIATSPSGPVNSAVDIIVSNPTGSSTPGAADLFTYAPSPLPVIRAISPSSGPSEGGTIILISGENLGDATRVQFSDVDALGFFIMSPGLIQATSPPTRNPVTTPTALDVTVTAPAGPTAHSTADLFTYNPTPLPSIKAVLPASGSASGGGDVWITGDNLRNPTQVLFGTIAAKGVFAPAENVVHVIAPAGTASATPVDVFVSTPSGQSANVNNKYTYTATPAPVVLAVGPNTGPAGTLVYISGTDLAGVTEVDFGTSLVTGAFFNLSPNVVRAVSAPGGPSTPPAAVDVTVIASGGTSAPNPPADSYTYTAASAPTLTVISPNSGPAGTTVFITGEHLGGATSVDFGGTAAPSFFVRSDSSIQVQSPTATGALYVHVTTGGGTSASRAAGLYRYPGSGPIVVAALPAMANHAYGGYTTVVYLRNLGAGPASVNIRYFDSTGAHVGAGDSNGSLAANGTWIVRQDNGNSLPLNTAGSALISSDQPVAAFVNEFAPGNTDASSYSAIQVPDGTGATLYAPTIVNNAYGGYTTGLGVVNAGDAATDVTITYRQPGGTSQKTQAFTAVAAHAYIGVYSGSSGVGTDASLPDGFIGAATIHSSGQPLAAITNETGPGHQFSSYDAIKEGSTELQAPVALNGAYGGFHTGMAVQDVGGGGGAVTVKYFDQGGALVKTVPNLPLAPNGSIGIYQGDAQVGPPASGSGYTAVMTSDTPIAAIVNEVAPPVSGSLEQQSTSYNTFAGGAEALSLPLVESAGSDGWSTGEGIMNTGSTATTVTVTYFDLTSGAPVGTPQTNTLQPNAFWGVYQPAGGLPAGTRGSAQITTSGGTVAVVCNETSPSSFMSYVGQ